jgi:hypothetical protein
MESPKSLTPMKLRQVKSKVKSMLIVFFDVKWIVHKKIHPGRRKNKFRILLLRFSATTRKFSPRRLTTNKNDMTVVNKDPAFLFPRLKIKRKDRHFDTIEVIKAESQASENTTSRMNFKKWQKRWKRRMRAEGDCFDGDGGQ